jgi:KaiC/GvpD/RAD55 family RecA-like ATPase
MSTQLVALDIPGLDLPLGGGLWTLERKPGTPASTVVLIRGAPGSGKTVFGCQLAGAVARALGTDVAYGCVELLPVELQAQHAGLRRKGLQEEVLVPPFKSSDQPSQQGTRIFAGLLDLGESGEEQARLGSALHALLTEVERVGGRPRVLVIDSLSDGYDLGSSASRLLADSLCKMAVERGLVLILLEEMVEARPSAWSFAVDVVLELAGLEEDRTQHTSAPFGRRLTIVKNRFGPSDAGPHRFTILSQQGLRVLPRPSAYLEPWAHDLLWGGWTKKSSSLDEQPWSIPIDGLGRGFKLPPFRDCATVVYSVDPLLAFNLARRLGSKSAHWSLSQETSIFIALGHTSDTMRSEEGPGHHGEIKIGIENPYTSEHALFDRVRRALALARHRESLVSRVLVGDLLSLRDFWTPTELRRAVVALVIMFRRANVPVVLFETVPSRRVYTQQSEFTGHSALSRMELEGEPEVISFADVSFWLSPGPADTDANVVVKIRETGERSDLMHMVLS